jgi:hypothetical protein
MANWLASPPDTPSDVDPAYVRALGPSIADWLYSDAQMSQAEAAGRGFIKGATANWYPALAGLQASSPAGSIGRTGSVGGNVVQGLLTRGAEGLGLIQGDSFTNRGEAMRRAQLAADKAASTQWADTSAIGELGGALAVPVPAAKLKLATEGALEAGKLGPWLARFLERTAQNTKAGAKYGAVASAGQATSEGQSAPGIAANTVIGTGAGAAMGAVPPTAAALGRVTTGGGLAPWLAPSTSFAGD